MFAKLKKINVFFLKLLKALRRKHATQRPNVSRAVVYSPLSRTSSTRFRGSVRETGLSKQLVVKKKKIVRASLKKILNERLIPSIYFCFYLVWLFLFVFI